jgi:hypothetical protein
MNFDTIVTNVENYLLDLPAETVALVPTWVNEAIKDAEKRYNFTHMKREQLLIETTVNQRFLIAIAANWKEDRVLPYLTDNNGFTGEIDWAPSNSDMVRQYSDDPTVDIGAPQFLLNEYDETLETYVYNVFPYPDGQSQYTNGEYRVNIPYYAYTGDLSGSENNFITNNGEFYVIYKAVAMGMFFNRDEQRGGAYDQLAEREYKKLKNQDKRTKNQRRNELTIRTQANRAGRYPRAPFRR